MTEVQSAATALVEAKREVNNWFHNILAADLILALVKADQRFHELHRASNQSTEVHRD